MPSWTFDPASRRYRNEKGLYVGDGEMLGLRDAYIGARKEGSNWLAARVADKDLTVAQWTEGMRQNIKSNFINQYVLAHGGRSSMTPADWGRIGQMVKTQYTHLDKFASDIANDRYSEEGIAARARMYVEASSLAFERGKVAARGIPDLPAFPSDGATPCLANCRCNWDIRETNTTWECSWVLGASEHCEGCKSNASKWNPLVIAKGGA